MATVIRPQAGRAQRVVLGEIWDTWGSDQGNRTGTSELQGAARTPMFCP